LLCTCGLVLCNSVERCHRASPATKPVSAVPCIGCAVLRAVDSAGVSHQAISRRCQVRCHRHCKTQNQHIETGRFLDHRFPVSNPRALPSFPASLPRTGCSPVSTSYQRDTCSVAYAIAARAGVDHRPVINWLRGVAPLPRGATGERIALAAAELGVAPVAAAPDGCATPAASNPKRQTDI
jgi:hypothetical protein